MRAVLALALALVAAACTSSDRPPAAGADVWGTYETGLYGEVGDLRSLHVIPPEGGLRDVDVERVIRRTLERRGYALADDASHILRYIIHTVLTDSGEGGLGVTLGGSLGSSSGVNDFGVGLELPLLGGGASVRQVSFLFELALEGPGGALLWRGRARGRTHLSDEGRIARPLAPLLLDRLGRNSPPSAFAR